MDISDKGPQSAFYNVTTWWTTETIL